MFKKFIIGIVVLVVAAVIATVMSINTIATKAIETGGTSALGTKVTVDGVNISLLSQNVRIDGLTIANPEGFSDAPYLRVGAFEVQATDLMGDPIIIDSILLSGTEMNVEITKSGSNTQAIKSNMKSAQKSDTSGEDTGAKDAGPGKKLVIRDLKITGTKVSATTPFSEKKEQTLPDIHMTDLGTEEQAIEPPEAVRRVMAELNKAALEASQGSLTDKIKNQIEEKSGNITDGIKGMFGK